MQNMRRPRCFVLTSEKRIVDPVKHFLNDTDYIRIDWETEIDIEIDIDIDIDTDRL